MALISFRNFLFSYSPGAAPALSTIDMDIARNETVVVSGLSGAGKSTLCIAAADLIEAYPASAVTGIIARGETELNGTIRTAIVMQNFYAQISYLKSTVFEEIAFPCENLGLKREEIIRRTEDAIEKTRIRHLALRSPLELSGGEKQKVVLATALAQMPDLLILDEPLSQLDPESAYNLTTVLTELKGKISLLIAENDPYLTLKIADRVAVLSDGRIIADGPLKDILSDQVETLLDIPAWTRCVLEAERSGRLKSGESMIPYELNYKKALSYLRSIR